MRTRAFSVALLANVVIGYPPVGAQVDQQRAQEFFNEVQALCEQHCTPLGGVCVCNHALL
jgi:hypothetical protein